MSRNLSSFSSSTFFRFSGFRFFSGVRISVFGFGLTEDFVSVGSTIDFREFESFSEESE
jgi:hypothetical protein